MLMNISTIKISSWWCTKNNWNKIW